MAIEIKEVTTKKELKQFIQFGIDLFKGNPYFCPPLVFDEINTFDTTKNPAHEICDHIIYMAYKDGKIVGLWALSIIKLMKDGKINDFGLDGLILLMIWLYPKPC